MDLLYGVPVTVTLDFSQQRFMAAADEPPEFNISQLGNKNKLAFGLVFHIKQIVQSFMETFWKTQEKGKTNDLQTLKSMGFDQNLGVAALSYFKNNLQTAVTNLLQGWKGNSKKSFSPQPKTDFQLDLLAMKDLQEMGFERNLVEAALLQGNNQMHQALDLLVNGLVKPQKQEITSEEHVPLPNTSQATKLVSLINYIKRRLVNYTQYCMICSSGHACGSEKPLVCCNALCLFRYNDVYGRQNMSIDETITICPFTECFKEEESLDASFTLGESYGNPF